IFRTERVGAKIQRPGEWRSGVTWISAEDHVNRHCRDCLIVVIGDRDGKSVEPVIIVIESFADLDVCFFLILYGDHFDGLNAPGLPDYSPSLLLSLSTDGR